MHADDAAKRNVRRGLVVTIAPAVAVAGGERLHGRGRLDHAVLPFCRGAGFQPADSPAGWKPAPRLDTIATIAEDEKPWSAAPSEIPYGESPFLSLTRPAHVPQRLAR